MTFAIGIFDLFTYSVPGVLQLSFIVYCFWRLGDINVSHIIITTPTALLLFGTLLLSYVLGHITYSLASALERLIPTRHRYMPEARAEFVRRVPEAQQRRYLHVDKSLLQAAAELHSKEVASEIARLRAIGLLMRSAAATMLIGSVAAVVEICTGPYRVIAACGAVVLLSGAVGAYIQRRKMAHWANLKTLEICFWIPNIDDQFAPVDDG